MSGTETPEKEDVSSLEDFENDSTESDDNSNNNFQFVTEKKVCKDQTYILHVAASSEAGCNVVVGTSDNVCEVYRFGENQLAKVESFEPTARSITGIQCNSDNSNLFYCGTNESVKLWDLRSPDKCAVEFFDTNVASKSISCFEASPNGRLLAVGTELHKGEAFMLFWDIRKVSLMGGYWETHADTVTQTKFDPKDSNKLMSGSVDGLINIYDIKNNNEDDALLDSYNTESSVEQLLWFSRKGKDCICCVTPTYDIQLWSTDDAEPFAHFRRLDVTKAIKRKYEAHCYVVSAHKRLNDELLVLAGTSSKDKDYLKCLQISNKELEFLGTLPENKQRVRTSFYNPYHNILLTGGELGILTVWTTSFKL